MGTGIWNQIPLNGMSAVWEYSGQYSIHIFQSDILKALTSSSPDGTGAD